MVIRYTGYGTMNPPEKKILMSEKEQDISPEIFEHLVKLAALELDEKEAEYLRRELNHQLSAIHELEAIRLDPDLPLASHGVSYDAHNSSALRADEWPPARTSRISLPRRRSSRTVTGSAGYSAYYAGVIMELCDLSAVEVQN
jgi:Asp-tRNA(Asn)/Glu-tRNA(Gln) amidotransferase C subunit